MLVRVCCVRCGVRGIFSFMHLRLVRPACSGCLWRAYAALARCPATHLEPFLRASCSQMWFTRFAPHTQIFCTGEASKKLKDSQDGGMDLQAYIEFRRNFRCGRVCVRVRCV